MARRVRIAGWVRRFGNAAPVEWPSKPSAHPLATEAPQPYDDSPASRVSTGSRRVAVVGFPTLGAPARTSPPTRSGRS